MPTSSASFRPTKLSISDTTLANGLRVLIVPKRNASVINITVAYKVGAKDESPRNTGFAHLFEHLMFEGSSDLADGAFDRLCTAAGGNNNAYTTEDKTIYYMVLPSHQLELGLWLESRRMGDFSVAQNSLEVQQSVVTEEIGQNVENRPYGRYSRTQAALAFREGAPYSWDVYGSVDHVRQATLGDVRSFYELYYKPDNACLILCGDVDPEQALPLVERYFGSIAGSHTAIKRGSLGVDDRNGGVHEVLHDHIPMNSVFLSYHTEGLTHDNFFTAEILASILSDGMSSRLYRSLVYEKQIASEVGAYLDERELSSLFSFYTIGSKADVTCDQLNEAIKGVITTLIDRGVEDREIQKARNRIETRVAQALQRNSGIADEIAHQTLFFDDPERILRLGDYFNQVNADAVRDYASATLQDSLSVRIDFVPAAGR